MAGVPSQWEETGQEEKGESGAGVPSQWEGTGQEEKGESGMAGVPSQWEGTGQGEESGMSARSEAESEPEVGSGAGLEAESILQARRGPFVASAAPWWDCARPATRG
jgi:hypothetical protein